MPERKTTAVKKRCHRNGLQQGHLLVTRGADFRCGVNSVYMAAARNAAAKTIDNIACDEEIVRFRLTLLVLGPCLKAMTGIREICKFRVLKFHRM
jgi:hypothetical protein